MNVKTHCQTKKCALFHQNTLIRKKNSFNFFDNFTFTFLIKMQFSWQDIINKQLLKFKKQILEHHQRSSKKLILTDSKSPVLCQIINLNHFGVQSKPKMPNKERDHRNYIVCWFALFLLVTSQLEMKRRQKQQRKKELLRSNSSSISNGTY